MNPETLIARIVTAPPGSLRALEIALGPEHAGAASTELQPIDIHHQDPSKIADPELASFRLRLGEGRRECEILLRARFGEPVALMDGERRVLGFHPFYLFDGAPNALELLWSRAKPAFAHPGRAPRVAAAFEDLAARLPALVAAATTLQEVDVLRHSLRADAGVAIQRRRYGNRWSLVLRPPVAARDLARLLGIARPYALASDVNQTFWTIQSATSPPGARLSFIRPAFGVWHVWAELVERPEGGLPRESWGASPAYDLDEHPAEVWRIALETDARPFSSGLETPACDADVYDEDLVSPHRGFTAYAPPREPLRPSLGPSPAAPPGWVDRPPRKS